VKQIGCDTAVSAILFDWDGTLLNSYRADASAYERMFHALGIQWGREDLEKHYSPNWHRVYRAAGIPQSNGRRPTAFGGMHIGNSIPHSCQERVRCCAVCQSSICWRW
jgi:phosphoglycolate phosphatase-like HAD superfamily hydrolase